MILKVNINGQDVCISKVFFNIEEDFRKKMRGDGPFIFARAKDCFGIDEIINHILTAREKALEAKPVYSLRK